MRDVTAHNMGATGKKLWILKKVEDFHPWPHLDAFTRSRDRERVLEKNTPMSLLIPVAELQQGRSLLNPAVATGIGPALEFPDPVSLNGCEVHTA